MGKQNERLKIVREELGYTQEQFAEIMEMSLSGYKKIERGEVKLSLEKIYILNKKLGLSADYILFGKKPEFGEVWMEACKLSDLEKWKTFMRLYSYLSKKLKNTPEIYEMLEIVDRDVSQWLSDNDCGK